MPRRHRARHLQDVPPANLFASRQSPSSHTPDEATEHSSGDPEQHLTRSLQHLPMIQRQRMVARLGMERGNRAVQRLLSGLRPALNKGRIQRVSLDPDEDQPMQKRASPNQYKEFLPIKDGTSRLQVGDNNDGVARMQEVLAELGYKTPEFGADGIFGKETLKALKKFQSENGLVDTGVFDKLSLDVMSKMYKGRDPHEVSFRFEGDKDFERIAMGTKTLKKGAKGATVGKMQQALVDQGIPLPKHGVDRDFGDETETALKTFQSKVKITDSGILDATTLAELVKVFGTRQPYLDQAKFDPANPGTRNLSAAEQKAAFDALVPQRGVGGKPATFQDEVAGKKYGDEVRTALDSIIPSLHKELFEDKEKLRADPKTNFHDWSVLEGAAKGSKQVVDALYSSYIPGGGGPEMTNAKGNFVDQWEDELKLNAALDEDEKRQKARNKVLYLINNNMPNTNARHSAIPSAPQEKAILRPIIESFVDTPAKVQTMLELDIGWEGAQLEGVVYLQRFKQQGKDKADADTKNRHQLWEIFHTCIHEYLHGVTHPRHQKYAQKLKNAGDSTRYETLIEGFTDFFTVNVRKTVTVTDALRKQVEGPYYDAKATPPTLKEVNPGVYPLIAQAEQVVGIVGIKNAQASYFQGQVEFIGGKLP